MGIDNVLAHLETLLRFNLSSETFNPKRVLPLLNADLDPANHASHVISPQFLWRADLRVIDEEPHGHARGLASVMPQDENKIAVLINGGLETRNRQSDANDL